MKKETPSAQSGNNYATNILNIPLKVAHHRSSVGLHLLNYSLIFGFTTEEHNDLIKKKNILKKETYLPQDEKDHNQRLTSNRGQHWSRKYSNSYKNKKTTNKPKNVIHVCKYNFSILQPCTLCGSHFQITESNQNLT